MRLKAKDILKMPDGTRITVWYSYPRYGVVHVLYRIRTVDGEKVLVSENLQFPSTMEIKDDEYGLKWFTGGMG